MSEHRQPRNSGRLQAGPKRPGPQGQERDR